MDTAMDHMRSASRNEGSAPIRASIKKPDYHCSHIYRVMLLGTPCWYYKIMPKPFRISNTVRKHTIITHHQ